MPARVHGPVLGTRRLKKGLKQPFLVVFAHSDPLVLDQHLKLVLVARALLYRQLRVNGNFFAFGGELYRVLEKVNEDLLDAQGVDLYNELARQGRLIDLDILLAGLV